MSDADRFGKLSPRWLSVSRKMSEGYVDNLSLADTVMESLHKDIRRYGNDPISFIKKVAIRLNSIRNRSSLLSSSNWLDENTFIRDLGSEYEYSKANKRGIEIAIYACEDVLREIRYRKVIGNIEEILMEQYIQRIYSRNFVGEVQVKTDGHVVKQKIDEISTLVDDGIVSLASQLGEKRSVKDLRLQRLAPKIPITLETEIPVLEIENEIS